MKSRHGKSIALRLVRAIGAGSWLAVATAGMAAEDAPKPAREIVTGTNIRRPAVADALPVITLDREYIERSGATTASELIQTLPVMQNLPARTVAVPAGATRPQR